MGYAAEHLQDPQPLYGSTPHLLLLLLLLLRSKPCCSPSWSWGAPSYGRSIISLRLESSFSFRTRCSTRTSAGKLFLSPEEVLALVDSCARGLLAWVQLS